MRCRYCNKAISLLRRLNDAEYCSDSHRFADAEEQQLAMRRLAENQPSLQRTQRVAVARAAHAGSVEVDAPAQAFAVQGTMTVIGGPTPFLPSPAPGERKAAESPDALHAPAVVLFRDRDHRFRGGMPWIPRMEPVPWRTVAAAANRCVTIGQLTQVRIVYPRELGSGIRRQRTWSDRPIETLCAVPGPSHASCPIVFRRPEPAFRSNPFWMARPTRRPERKLTQATQLSRVPQTVTSKHPQPVPPSFLPLSPVDKFCFPASRLTAVAPERPAPPTEDLAEFWAIVEDTPLAALLAATQYTTVAPSQHPPSTGVFAETVLSVPFSSRVATVSHVAERAAALQVPACSALLALTGSVATKAGARSPQAQIYFEAAVDTCLPVASARQHIRELSTCTAILPLDPPLLVDGARSRTLQQDWVEPAYAQLYPAREKKLPKPGLRPAAVLAVAAPGSAAATPGCGESCDWFPLDFVLARPASRFDAFAGAPATAQRVSCDLRPDPARCLQPHHSSQKLQSVIRVRLPEREPASPGRFSAILNRFRCLPVPPPAVAAFSWSPAIDAGTGLCPTPVLPKASKAIAARSLRRLPIRLFKVPGAKPMARPLGGKPVSFPMGLWASPPAIRAISLSIDDGKRRHKPLPAERLSQQLRERFSQDRLHKFWTKFNYLPSDLKWIAMVVPLIVGIWAIARPSEPFAVSATPAAAEEVAVVESAALPKEESHATVVAPVVSQNQSTAEKESARSGSAAARVTPETAPGGWDAFTARIASRASVDYIEDFRNGLSQWEGKGEWARSWSYDRSGTVRPGQMAVFQPTVNLRDYAFEMKAAIDRHSIQWMVRASGPQNYHFARLNVTPGSPLTKLELERWSVVNGRAGRVTRLPLPHASSNQTLYLIRVEVRGDSVTTYLHDQVIDTFSDPRLPEGGIGLVGNHEDRPRIYGIRVTHQNDFLGKLCSFLAPPPINNQGSD